MRGCSWKGLGLPARPAGGAEDAVGVAWAAGLRAGSALGDAEKALCIRRMNLFSGLVRKNFKRKWRTTCKGP